LHKDLLCYYSDFFRAAFDGSFREAFERKIELPDVETDVFEAFQFWLYTQGLPGNEFDPDEIHPEWSLLVKLWIFGDQHQTPLLQNHVLDVMWSKITDSGNPLFMIEYVYENTTSSSPLRKVVIDLMLHRAEMGQMPGEDFTLADQACTDMMVAAINLGSGDRNQEYVNRRERFHRCHYHVHAEGEHC
jgi:hypothetical protein